MSLTVKEAIETRRSIREYVQEPIPKEEILEILRLASLAPSAWNTQPWRFIVITDQAKKSELQKAANNQKQVGNAPAVIVVTSDMEDVLGNVEQFAHPKMSAEAKNRLKETIERTFSPLSVEARGQWAAGQTYIAVGFLLLAIRSLGYDSSTMLGFDPIQVRELLNLPSHVQIPAIIALGKKAESGNPHHRHPLEKIVTWID
jgi:nitroreductase